ncbi:hypothetical protein EON65_21005 [archaeon]|nr:MAG: hypothetical protein EON65_21005 [archaeon]
MELSKLLHKRRILAMYPLHEEKTMREIESRCMDKWTFPWQVPIHSVKEYFGEKIALYNVFLGHYSLWLIVPSIVGLAFQLVVWGTLDFSSPVLPFYSLIITVWSVFMLEYWKRQESTTAMVWGMSEFESQEQDRPEFKGSTMKSFIDGRDITYNPPSLARKIMTLTQSVVACFITLVIGVVAGIYFFRFTLQKRNSTSPYASTVASVLNTVQILVFNAIYQVAALKLTDMENHRTDTSYEDSLIIKMFVFQFINSYASFFFIAFIAGNLERPDNVPDDFLGQCGATNCMEPLSINLAIIFGSRLTITNLIDIAIPYFTHNQKIKKETSGIEEAKKVDITKAENEYYLMQYKPMIDSIQNYADTAVQYGFTLLFITALPCASFFSLLNNYVKVKFTTWKLCRLYQRPIPSGAQDIGTWQTIFAIISVASVVTNAALVCFTMDVLWGYSLQGRVWIFIGFQWVLIMCQFVAQAIVPDIPEDVTIQLERTHFYNEKVVEKVEDEDYDETEADDEFEDNHDGGAAACCGLVSRSKTKKMRSDLSNMPTLDYPRGIPENAWPAPLAAHDSRLGPAPSAPLKAPLKETTVDSRPVEAAGAINPALNNYASSYSAVPVAANNNYI